MARTPIAGAALCLLLALATPASAQSLGGLLSLIPPDILEGLELDSEQTRQIQQLDRGFKQSCFQTLVVSGLKIMAIVDKSKKDEEGEPAPTLAIAHELTGTLLNIQRSQVSYQRKAIALLTEDQKARYHRLRLGQPADPVRASPILAASLEEKLKLDPAQADRVKELRRETEQKLRAILNPEQRRLLEEWIKGKN